MATKKISKKDAELLAQLRANGLHAEADAFEVELAASNHREKKSQSLKKGDVLRAHWSVPDRNTEDWPDFYQVTQVRGDQVRAAPIWARTIHVWTPDVGNFRNMNSDRARMRWSDEELGMLGSKMREAEGTVVYLTDQSWAEKWDGVPAGVNMVSKKMPKKNTTLLAELRAKGLHAEADAFEAELAASKLSEKKSHSLEKGDILRAHWSVPGLYTDDWPKFYQVTQVSGDQVRAAPIWGRTNFVYTADVDKFINTNSDEARMRWSDEELGLFASKMYESDGTMIYLMGQSWAEKWDGIPLAATDW